MKFAVYGGGGGEVQGQVQGQGLVEFGNVRVQSARMEMVKTGLPRGAVVKKPVQDGVSQAAIDRVLGEDPEGETPEEFRGDMGERRGRGGTRRRKEGEQHVCGHRKGWSLLKEAEAAPIEN